MEKAEKENLVNTYCQVTGDNDCKNCALKNKEWLHPLVDGDGNNCLCIVDADEWELDKALKLIGNDGDESAIKPHYYNDTKIAPIDVIEDWDLDFCLGSALKYIKRCGKKENNPSVQDLKKVIWYIERRIQELEEG